MLQDIIKSDNTPFLYLNFSENLKRDEAFVCIDTLLENYFTVNLLSRDYPSLGSKRIEKEYNSEKEVWKYTIVGIEGDSVGVSKMRGHKSQALAFVNIEPPKEGYKYYGINISMGVNNYFGNKFKLDKKLSMQFSKGFFEYAEGYRGKEIT